MGDFVGELLLVGRFFFRGGVPLDIHLFDSTEVTGDWTEKWGTVAGGGCPEEGTPSWGLHPPGVTLLDIDPRGCPLPSAPPCVVGGGDGVVEAAAHPLQAKGQDWSTCPPDPWRTWHRLPHGTDATTAIAVPNPGRSPAGEGPPHPRLFPDGGSFFAGAWTCCAETCVAVTRRFAPALRMECSGCAVHRAAPASPFAFLGVPCSTNTNALRFMYIHMTASPTDLCRPQTERGLTPVAGPAPTF